MSAHEVGSCLFLFCAGFLVGRFFEIMVGREQQSAKEPRHDDE
jgi:hypothetical protein